MNTQSVNIRIQKVVFYVLETTARKQGVSLSLYIRNILKDNVKQIDNYWGYCVVKVFEKEGDQEPIYLQCKICDYKTDDVSDEAFIKIKQHILQAHEL